MFAARAQYLGDPDFMKVPVAALTDPAYLARRAAEVDSVNPSKLASVQPGLEKPQTTHFSIVDRWGNPTTRRRRDKRQPQPVPRLAALLTVIPSLSRPELGRLVQRMIDHMDQMDGDP